VFISYGTFVSPPRSVCIRSVNNISVSSENEQQNKQIVSDKFIKYACSKLKRAFKLLGAITLTGVKMTLWNME
jgi:hypothetical protein